jgi:DNA-binding FrmR family transcriptional regulator
MAGYSMRKKDLDARLARIEGQVRGIRRMLAEDTYCIDVLTQLSSVTGAIRAVGLGLLDDHVRHCVKESLVQGDGEDKITELVAAVERFATR